LTTAASLWVTAAVGVAVGLRQWLPAVAATGLAIGVLLVVKRLEHDEELRKLGGVRGVDMVR